MNDEILTEKIRLVSSEIHKDIKRGDISHIGGELRLVLEFAGEGSYIHIEPDNFEITLKSGRKVEGLHLYHRETDTQISAMT